MLKIKNITKSFNNVNILKNFSLEINDGEIISLLAPSGAGKTTLLNCISKLDKIDSGEIIGNDNISMVFQDDRLLPWLDAYTNINIISKNENKTLELLNLVGIDEQSHYKFPSQLSGGMKKRINIARALSANYDVLLLDEAFTGINNNFKYPIMNYILNNTNKKCTIFITHDVETAFYLGNIVIALKGTPLEIIKIYSDFNKDDSGSLISEAKTFL